jgi:hypothetical protein
VRRHRQVVTVDAEGIVVGRISTGELNPRGARVRLGDHLVLVGDEVVTRCNNRSLRTDRDLIVKNRDHWTVTAIHHDRSVTLGGPTGSIRAPADYAAEHLELGYAQTSHANQGRTIDSALLLVDGPTDSRGVYTPITRGRYANHVYVVTEGNQTPVEVLAHAVTRDWIDQPAIARRAQLESHLQQNPTPRPEPARVRRNRLTCGSRTSAASPKQKRNAQTRCPLGSGASNSSSPNAGHDWNVNAPHTGSEKKASLLSDEESKGARGDDPPALGVTRCDGRGTVLDLG